ncbi:MAG: cytidylate kinase-like family protein [Propionibacteriaceae bacterium]|jgi:hypothetical protein|uniref:cytidylate kinase-like family protein n=1 Tax=Dietzia sp. UBA5065 TaxID=1946422 RepID=UPI000E7FA7D4|nr:cytidylate kinase-like family protein [Dietzia sp. UBA5065]MBK9157149.1 cytidylate kinase-like family protein [Micropruina sp.]HBX80289.1 hypothetical protein [Propionibacteriaceae bacterium]HBY22524.1 hypothetical protein [Propionibacteriaceae bacterium]
MSDPVEPTPPVVTLWEEYGCGAEQIGPALAEALGVRWVGQSLSSHELETAEREADEQPFENLIDLYAVVGDNPLAPIGGEAVINERYANIADVTAEAAEGAVILGRNATVILAGRPNTVHVKLVGPKEQRIARAAEAAGISVARAKHRQVREDRVRADFALRMHSWDPHRYTGYDLTLDVTEHTAADCVDRIIAALRGGAATDKTR